MKTVNEVSKQFGVSARTLRYYDSIGLLKPTAVSEAGYRFYDDSALAKLQTILLFRELSFPLEEIQTIISNPAIDRKQILKTQLASLEAKQAYLTELIDYVRTICESEGNIMGNNVFDTQKMNAYAKEAKQKWGNTAAYQEYEAKHGQDSSVKQKKDAADLMEIFAEFGQMRTESPESEIVQAQVKHLQDFITAHYYTCTDEILAGLGQMYASGGEMTENIDRYSGAGTAAFAAKAIESYCKK